MRITILYIFILGLNSLCDINCLFDNYFSSENKSKKRRYQFNEDDSEEEDSDEISEEDQGSRNIVEESPEFHPKKK